MEKRYCPNCGAKVSKTARCCLECGEFLEQLPLSASAASSREAKQAEDFNDRIRRVLGNDKTPNTTPSLDTTPETNKDFGLNKPQSNKKPLPRDKAEKSLGLPGLMGLQLLFVIPVIGLIAAIILCARKKTEKAVKLQAKSRIAWTIVAVSIFIILYAVYELWLRNFLLSNDILGLSFGKFNLYFSDFTITRLFG